MKLPIQMEQLTSTAETNTRGKEMEMSEGCCWSASGFMAS